jgi:hypothetical protein
LIRGSLIVTASSSRQWGAVLLVATLGVLGIVANLLQLVSAGGYWVWVTILSVPILGLLILAFAGPVLRRNVRGTWLFESLRRTGLIDIEHRADREYRLPPERIFHAIPSGPVLITGILDQLFQYHREEILAYIHRGNELKVLLIHPVAVAEGLMGSWAGYRDEWVRYWVTNCNEALVALDAIIEAELDRVRGFSIRFMTKMPPYFGMLIGDPNENNASSLNPLVRVQPIAISKFVGRGTVITFEKIKRKVETPFDYYAQDLLAQWDEGVEDIELIGQRRQALNSDLN